MTELDQTAEIDSTTNDAVDGTTEETQDNKQSGYAKLLAQRNQAREEARQLKEQLESKTASQPQNSDPDLDTLETWMDQRMEAKGYVKKDALTKRDAEQQMNMALQDLVKDNPGLKSYETAIKKLVESTGEHPADVVEKYLPDADKLMKAKSSNSDIMGSNNKGGKNVSFGDMTPAQRTEWYSKNRDSIKNSGERFVKTGNV